MFDDITGKDKKIDVRQPYHLDIYCPICSSDNLTLMSTISSTHNPNNPTTDRITVFEYICNYCLSSFIMDVRIFVSSKK